jgi:hypothetical protein
LGAGRIVAIEFKDAASPGTHGPYLVLTWERNEPVRGKDMGYDRAVLVLLDSSHYMVSTRGYITLHGQYETRPG